jgi:CRP-like cAMP-binding protein
MLQEIKEQIPGFWDNYGYLFKELKVPAKTILLREREISGNLYCIAKGCLRLWFNNKGKDVTFQFFFENQAVSSIESFMNETPNLFNLESIEPSELFLLSKKNFDILFRELPQLKDGFNKIILQRMENYANLFLSRIKDTPRQRYKDLIKNNPHILQRVPQHYIASYLGITPVSLSRIRNKL